MNLLAKLLHRPQPAHTADSVIARRIESDRARKAAADKRAQERAVCIAKAATLGRVSQPMTPRAEIAAQVQAEREARKQSPLGPVAQKSDESGLANIPFMAAGEPAATPPHSTAPLEFTPTGLFGGH